MTIFGSISSAAVTTLSISATGLRRGEGSGHPHIPDGLLVVQILNFQSNAVGNDDMYHPEIGSALLSFVYHLPTNPGSCMFSILKNQYYVEYPAHAYILILGVHNNIAFQKDKSTYSSPYLFFCPTTMACCFSFTASTNQYYHLSFVSAGMKSKLVELGDGTTMHCWVPKRAKEKPALVLIHGLGANAMWQWSSQIRPFRFYFNLYVPDLVFFGKSFTTRAERTELFQAQCVMKLLECLGVPKFHVVGVSYGGFVAYSLAHTYPLAVQKVGLVSSGVCMKEKDMEEGLFKVSDFTTAINILLPQTAANLKILMKLSFSKPPKMVPSCLLQDFIHIMVTDKREEKTELVNSILEGKKASILPVISQETLIIWGDHDQIFPLELGNRLKRHLGDRAEMVVFKDAGHAVHLEKPKAFNKQLKKFLLSG